MNCQLARTNINLGGQMKWDLILNNIQNQLVITDFHLTPISDYIPYNYQNEENLLNNSHLENIKGYYNKIHNSFFKNATDPKLTTKYPLNSNHQLLKAYDDTYICGIKREKYSRYKKQFACFCPLWIENPNDLKNMQFHIDIFRDSTYSDINSIIHPLRIPIIQKSIDFQPIDNMDFHNKFIQYLYNYVDEINLNDELCNFKFTIGESYIKGINAEYGVVETKDTSYTLNNLLDRERPLLEADDMIMQQFASNKVIARQLFNFNFIFDASDLFGSFSAVAENGDFNIEMYVTINHKYRPAERLEFKDFFNNYEFIEKPVIYDNDYNAKKKLHIPQNCLDYLQDYKCINFIDKNKINPQTCHWSLVDNDNYLFQLYDGFAPEFINTTTKQVFNSSHKYFDMPDVWDQKYSFVKNNLNWVQVNTEPLTSFNDIINIDWIMDSTPEVYSTMDFSSPDVCWINSLKYNISNISHKLLYADPNDKIFQIAIFNTEYAAYDIDDFDTIYTKLEGSDNIYFYIPVDSYMDIDINPNRLYILNTNYDNNSDLDDLTFRGFVSLLNKQSFLKEENLDKIVERKWQVLYDIKLLLNEIIKPTFIFYNKSITPGLINAPLQMSDNKNLPSEEIQYFKVDNYFNYLIRYDGKIRPCFISPEDKHNYFNYQYYYRNNNDMNWNKIFNKYTLTKFTPLYPSKDFFSINKINLDYKNINKDLYCLDNDKNIDDYLFEWKWFMDNRVIYLYPSLKIKIAETETFKIKDEKHLQEVIKQRLHNIYGGTDIKLNYIYNQYDVHYDYEYLTNNNIDDYLYIVTLNLK